MPDKISTMTPTTTLSAGDEIPIISTRTGSEQNYRFPLSSIVAGQTNAFSTWAQLAATVGGNANNQGIVYGPDTGTHTDPVVGGTVANVGVYAWSVTPAGWKRIADLSASAQTFYSLYNGGSAQTQLEWIPPLSALNSEGGHDNVNLSLQTAFGTFTAGNGQFGTDYVYALGWNLNDALVADKPGLPAVMFKIESKFIYNRFGTYVTHSEIHQALVTADASPVEFRPMTIGAPHFKADWANFSGITYQVAYISWLDGAISPTERMTLDITAASGPTGFLNTVRIRRRESTNDFPWHQQSNAANSAFLNLPYITSLNRLKHEQPIDIQANATTDPSGDVATVSFASIVPTNGALLSWTSVSVTGNNTGFNMRGSASTHLEGALTSNQHASGAAGYGTAGNGAQYYGFTDSTSGLNFGMRYVHSTATLSIGGQLHGASNGVGDFLTFDCASRQMTVAYPFKQTPITVASLPAPATAGAGARAMVSDATAPTFGATVAGAGAVVTPVYSDGTNWKVG